jgi:hypothetical protein
MRRLSVLTALAAVPILLAAPPAFAQEPRIGQAQVYRTVNPADMSTLLNGLDFQAVKKGGERRFDIETRDGFKFSVELTVCDVEDEPPGCLGVNLYATWGMEPGDETKLRAAVDRFNNEYRIGKALLLEDSVYAERYVITDGGVTLDHIRDEIGEFESAMGAFAELMAEALGE